MCLQLIAQFSVLRNTPGDMDVMEKSTRIVSAAIFELVSSQLERSCPGKGLAIVTFTYGDQDAIRCWQVFPNNSEHFIDGR